MSIQPGQKIRRPRRVLPVLESESEPPLEPGEFHDRPTRRAECVAGGWNAQRPCPYVSCRYHLYLAVQARTGHIYFTHPEKAPWELQESCALDVADRGGVALSCIGDAMGTSRERARQIEEGAVSKLRESYEMDAGEVALRPAAMSLCGCGCGTPVERYDSQGRRYRFVYGHRQARKEHGRAA